MGNDVVSTIERIRFCAILWLINFDARGSTGTLGSPVMFGPSATLALSAVIHFYMKNSGPCLPRPGQ